MKRKIISLNYDKNGATKLGEALTEIRLESGFKTKGQLSEKLNRDRTSFSKYESGKTVPGIETLYEIAEGLGYDLNIIFKPKEINHLNYKVNNTKNIEGLDEIFFLGQRISEIEITPDLEPLKDLVHIFTNDIEEKLKDKLVLKLNDLGINIDRVDFDIIGKCISLYSYSYSIVEWYERLDKETRNIIDKYIDISIIYKETLTDMQTALEQNYGLNNNQILTISKYICEESLNKRFEFEMSSKIENSTIIKSTREIKSINYENRNELFDSLVEDIICLAMFERSIAAIDRFGFLICYVKF